MQIDFIYKVSSGISHGLQRDYSINKIAFLSKYFYNNVHKLQCAWLKVFKDNHSNMLTGASRPQANIVSLFFFLLNLIKSSEYRDWCVFKLWLTGFQLIWVLYGSRHLVTKHLTKPTKTKTAQGKEELLPPGCRGSAQEEKWFCQDDTGIMWQNVEPSQLPEIPKAYPLLAHSTPPASDSEVLQLSLAHWKTERFVTFLCNVVHMDSL